MVAVRVRGEAVRVVVMVVPPSLNVPPVMELSMLTVHVAWPGIVVLQLELLKAMGVPERQEPNPSH